MKFFLASSEILRSAHAANYSSFEPKEVGVILFFHLQHHYCCHNVANILSTLLLYTHVFLQYFSAIFITASKKGGRYEYNTSIAVFLTDCLKLGVAVIALLQQLVS